MRHECCEGLPPDVIRSSVQAPGLEHHVLELLVVAENGRDICVEIEEFLSTDFTVLVEVNSFHQLLEHSSLALGAVTVISNHCDVEGGGQFIGR
jgi:hypothetical protein